MTEALSVDQLHVLELIANNVNVFLTGGGGVGKSHVIRLAVKQQTEQGQNVSVCASTGVAADHIGGTTLHAFLGLGLAGDPLPDLVRAAKKNNKIKQRWAKLDFLVIDEISMLDPCFFEKVDHVARALRQCDKPFGGVQLLLSGDFFQLPPVVLRQRPSTSASDGDTGTGSVAPTPSTFCFETRTWTKAVQATVELKYSFRQKSDNMLADLLARVRTGDFTIDDIETIASRLNITFEGAAFEGIEPTRMHSRRANVDLINETKLNELPTTAPKQLFTAHFHLTVSSLKRKDMNGSGNDNAEPFANTADKRKELQRVARNMEEGNSLPVKQQLELRVGAQVMLLCNLDIESGLVNGSRGVITRFTTVNDELFPVVRFVKNNDELCVTTHTWEYKLAAGSIYYTQIPLHLAWAITIHKAQGLSLDCVEMALDNSVFERGQAYVALSRVTSIAGLRLLSFKPSVIVAHPLVKQFYNQLRDVNT